MALLRKAPSDKEKAAAQEIARLRAERQRLHAVLEEKKSERQLQQEIRKEREELKKLKEEISPSRLSRLKKEATLVGKGALVFEKRLAGEPVRRSRRRKLASMT